MTDLLTVLALFFVASWPVGRYLLPRKPPQQQFEAGLSFLVRQLGLAVVAGIIVLAVWMVLT